MNIQDLAVTIESLKDSTRRAHQIFISSETSTKEVNSILKKADTKLASIMKGLYKSADVEFSTGEYEAPEKRELGNITQDFAKQKGTEILGNIVHDLKNIKESLKERKNMVIFRQQRSSHKLSNNTVSLFTKTISDLGKVISLLAPKGE